MKLTVNRTKYIERLIEDGFYWERTTLIAALVSCLDPQEACEILDLGFTQEPATRRAILRKIGRDVEHGPQECHYNLIEQLIHASERLRYSKKNSCGYCLSFLYDYLSEDLQRTIVEFFLTSRYVNMRRRAYKKLRSNWDPEYLLQVSHAWAKHRDFECALLIAERFPLSYLQEHLTDLEQVLIEENPRYLAKLFLRVGEVDSNKLERLASLDEITFAYVSAKLRQPLTAERALKIFESNRLDERIGLLIWCFGQMGLWSVLVRVANRAEELDQERLARIRAKYAAQEALAPDHADHGSNPK